MVGKWVGLVGGIAVLCYRPMVGRIRHELGEDSHSVIKVIDKPLLHQLNIAIIKGTLLDEKKVGAVNFGQNLGKKSGGFQSWSKPGQLKVGAVNFGQILGKNKVRRSIFVITWWSRKKWGLSILVKPWVRK